MQRMGSTIGNDEEELQQFLQMELAQGNASISQGRTMMMMMMIMVMMMMMMMMMMIIRILMMKRVRMSMRVFW